MGNHLEAVFERTAIVAEQWLTASHGPLAPLSNPDLQFGRRRFKKGWQFQVKIDQAPVDLHLLLTPEFPRIPPQIRVIPPEKYFFHVPHVEEDGILCLYDNGEIAPVDSPELICKDAVERAVCLLSNPRLDDFVTEFHSYWWRGQAGAVPGIWWLESPEATIGQPAAWIGERLVVVADSKSKLQSWLQAWGGKGTEEVSPVFVLVLPSCLLPSEYPKYVGDVLKLVDQHSVPISKSVKNHIYEADRPALLLLSMPADRGVLYAALRIPPIRLASDKALARGFRPGCVPENLILQRGAEKLKGTPVVRLKMQEVSHSYLHARGGAGLPLKDKHVMLIGCGSLGSYVAHILAKSGLGKMTLIDPDTLAWDNVARHVLGGADVCNTKASRLKAYLLAQLPHLCIDNYDTRWRELYDSDPELFNRPDLIMSTTGVWSTEVDLNLLARKEHNFPAVLFAWLESYAVAGHALLVHKTLGGCLNCSMSEFGEFGDAVITDNSDRERLRRVAGCGDFYEPYGLCEMTFVASLAACTAIDYLLGKMTESERRSWIGEEANIRQFGLTVTERWRSFIDNHPNGGVDRRPWPVHPRCSFCH